MPVHQRSLEFASGRPIITLGVSMSRLDSPSDAPAGSTTPYPLEALVDTGASQSQVDLVILQSLGLSQEGEDKVNTASTGNHPETMPLYLVDLSIVGDRSDPLIYDLKVFGSTKLAGLRVDMILGRDVLNQCFLVYDGPNRQYSLAYNPPAPDLY